MEVDVFEKEAGIDVDNFVVMRTDGSSPALWIFVNRFETEAEAIEAAILAVQGGPQLAVVHRPSLAISSL